MTTPCEFHPAPIIIIAYQPIAMATTPALSSHERTRVEDYLNDKIQISADLESLDSLLSSLRGQHDLQRKQVRADFTVYNLCFIYDID